MPAFVDEPLDRADARRTDAEGLRALLARPDARVLAFWRADPYLADGRPVLVAADLQPDAPTVFLGLDGEAPVFARSLAGSAPPPLAGAPADLRMAVGAMSPADGSVLGTARALFSWHHRHGFCSRCGVPTAPAHGGWRRLCPGCGTEHFPRVDPVAIMRIEQGDALLLGRSPAWPSGMWSCLAGFVEPGETVEAACAREAHEEAGVRVRDVRYVGSQPWPFPGSLMLGLACTAEGREVRVDPAELEAARWFDRDEVAALVARTHRDSAIPPATAIAHRLVASWLDG
ncbi:MAG: NAD(+) diphosphatase [Myxococcota bacterium]